MRDAMNHAGLTEAGWRVAIIWECAIRHRGEADVAAELANWLNGGGVEMEIG